MSNGTETLGRVVQARADRVQKGLILPRQLSPSFQHTAKKPVHRDEYARVPSAVM
jgi:hypothetical protein